MLVYSLPLLTVCSMVTAVTAPRDAKGFVVVGVVAAEISGTYFTATLGTS